MLCFVHPGFDAARGWFGASLIAAEITRIAAEITRLFFAAVFRVFIGWAINGGSAALRRHNTADAAVLAYA